MKRQKKIIASILAVAFVIGGTTCYAGSVYSMLYSDQSSVKTARLGNTTGKYRIVSNNNKNSKYAVELYLYKGKDSDDLKNKRIAKKIIMAADNEVQDVSVNVSKEDYTVARAYTYGNLKSNPKTGCIAATTVMNK